MSGIFNLDAPVWVFMGEVADLIILAFLWWIGCIGIVTIGASTSAAYYVLGKKIRKENTYVFKDFVKSYKQNFRQSVPLSLITILGTVSLSLYIFFIVQGMLQATDATYLKWVIPMAMFFAFEFLNFNSYLWAVLSRFDMKSKELIKTSFIMMHRHLLTTFGNMVVTAFAAFLVYKCLFLVLVVPVIIMGGQSFLFQNLFSRYIEAAEAKEEKRESAEGSNH